MSILSGMKDRIIPEDIERAIEVVGCFVFSGADENATLADARLALNEVTDVLALLRITGYYVIRDSETRPPGAPPRQR